MIRRRRPLQFDFGHFLLPAQRVISPTVAELRQIRIAVASLSRARTRRHGRWREFAKK